MKLKDLSLEELETKSYSELAEIVLSEKGTAMKIVDVFKKICKALKLSDAEFEDRIADFFELLATDKNFIILDKGKVDLRTKHDFQVVIEEDDEEPIEVDILPEDEPVDEEEEEDIFYDNSSDEDDPTENDDDLNDFIVVDEDEEEASI